MCEISIQLAAGILRNNISSRIYESASAAAVNIVYRSPISKTSTSPIPSIEFTNPVKSIEIFFCHYFFFHNTSKKPR